MTTLLFARHGQASFGHQEYDKLSPLGEEQACLLGEYYAQIQRPIQAVVNGTLSRQQASSDHFLSGYLDTGLLINKTGMAIARKTIADLNEYDHKDIFMKSDPAFSTEVGILAAIAQAPVPKLRLAELFGEAMQRWHSGAYDDDYLESWQQFNTRVHRGLQDIITFTQSLSPTSSSAINNTISRTFSSPVNSMIDNEIANPDLALHDISGQDTDNLNNPNSTVLIFTSGGVIAALVARLLMRRNELSVDKLTDAQLLNQQSQLAFQINRNLVNTGVTTLTVTDEGVKLLTLNEYGHLFAKDSRYVTQY